MVSSHCFNPVQSFVKPQLYQIMSNFIILSRHPVLGNNLVLNFDTAVKDQDLMLSMKMIFMLPTVISLIRQSLWTYCLKNGHYQVYAELHKPDDKLSHLYDLSLNDVREFIEDIRSQIFIEGLVHGNLSEDDAINISKIFEQIVPEKSPPTLLRHVRSLTFLPPNINFVVDRLSATNMSSAELYLQIGQNLFNSINLMALLDLFEVIVKKPFFYQLRTKEKLGYVVQSHSSETHNVWGFQFFIESSSHQPSYLQERIEIFLNGLGKTLKKLNDKTFKKYKTSLVDKKLKGCSSLEEESKRVWKEITKYSQQYNIAQKINVRSSERPREVGDPDEVKFEGDSDEEFKSGDFDLDEMKFEGDSDDFDEEFKSGDFDLDEMKFEGDSDDFDEEFKSGDFDLDEMNFDEKLKHEEFKSGDFDLNEMNFEEKLKHGYIDW
ncbi:Insulinase (Peptidase family M16) family protein [Trifolium repens]|nr:Insulinase (Peptidase family M16) family protein [Trifolium repens]